MTKTPSNDEHENGYYVPTGKHVVVDFLDSMCEEFIDLGNIVELFQLKNSSEQEYCLDEDTVNNFLEQIGRKVSSLNNEFNELAELLRE